MLTRLRRRTSLALRRYPLLPFLLVATVAIGFVIATAKAALPSWWGAYAYAVTGLLGVWASQLRGGWARRLPCAALAVVSVSLLGLLRDNKPAWSRSLTILLFYLFVVAAGSAMVRFAALWFRQRKGHKQTEIRYSLFGVFTTTTFVAIASALVRFANPPPQTALFAVIYLTWGGLLLSALLITRGRWGTSVSFAAIMLLAVVAGYTLVDLLQFPVDLLLSTVSQGILYAAWLLGLRSRTRKPQPAARYP